jgi:hypothetical protein
LADLTENRQIASNDRHSKRERFNQRQSEALCVRREKQRPSVREMCRELPIGAVTYLNNMASKVFVAVENFKRTFRLPAALADDH